MLAEMARDIVEDQSSAGYLARKVLRDEAAAILSYSESDDPSMDQAIEMIHASTGPLIVSGIGKSGHVGRKIASTFRSLGKPAVFLHAAEASHGDLGIIQEGSVVLVLSNSGETSELSDLLHYCREHGVQMIGLTGPADSTLAQVATIAITYGKLREACVNGLAPTTSTTISMAIGDALAVGVSFLAGVDPEDFRRYHPGGKLGSKLLSAADVMKVGASLPVVSDDTPMTEAVIVMSEKSMGIAIILEAGRAIGVVTDGDMRRNISRLWESSAGDIATRTPVRIEPGHLVSDAVDLMNGQGVTTCLVEGEGGKLVGLLHLHDCLAQRGS